jgi:YfiH family protein
MISRLLAELPWLSHDFGTRSGPLSQEGMASLKQIHSGVVLNAEAEGCAGEGDALVTNRPRVTVSVRTADCFPILLVDRRRRAVAAVHAGWRGTAAHIAIEALVRMRREFDTDPLDVAAAIGPGIGACCYEVGEDVARRFGMTEAGRLDLAAENERQLRNAGVTEIDRIGIDGTRACTFCHPEHFYSWRRDRDKAARMISYVVIRS